MLGRNRHDACPAGRVIRSAPGASVLWTYRRPTMHDFWITSGYHLLTRDADGNLEVGDELLRASRW